MLGFEGVGLAAVDLWGYIRDLLIVVHVWKLILWGNLHTVLLASIFYKIQYANGTRELRADCIFFWGWELLVAQGNWGIFVASGLCQSSFSLGNWHDVATCALASWVCDSVCLLDVLHLTLTVLSIQSFRAIVFWYLLDNANQASSWFLFSTCFL